ncbi:MAG TPA: phosphatidate cytidylyltransferase [Burkholderiales bacterium]|nr:phosphatidate cytidylyltransferase [Burkholderiales bacterium]
MLKQRVLTVAVALPLFLAALFYLPNRWWALTMMLLMIAGGYEWARLARFNAVARFSFLAVLAAGCIMLAMTPGHAAAERWIYGASLAFWCVAAPCWLRFKWRARAAALAVAGILVLLPTWLAAVRLQQEPSQLLTVLAVVWIADTAAFFTGKSCGKRKLAAHISPGKTWEGVAGAAVAVVLYAWLAGAFSLLPKIGTAAGMTAIIGAFLAMTALSIVGDLFESLLKRTAGVKDSGNLLPGHGGLLDRIDGITAALPFAALLYAGGGGA